MKRTSLIVISFCLFMPISVSAEKIIILAMDDIQSGWLENVQEYIVQVHIDNNIPVTLGVIPCTIEEPLLTKIKAWDNNLITEVAQHDFTHDTDLTGRDYDFQYNYISQGTNLLNGWGIYPESYVPAKGKADDTTVQVIKDLEFHTLYEGMYINLTPSTDPLVIVDQLHLCEDNGIGRWSVFKEYPVLVSEIEEKIEEYEVALVLYHMQDFRGDDGNPNTEKADQLIDYVNSFVQDGYDLMTVEQYYQYATILNECYLANRDGVGGVNFHDLAIVANDWQKTETGTPLDGDVNGDGQVDTKDLVILGWHWLSNCE